MKTVLSRTMKDLPPANVYTSERLRMSTTSCTECREFSSESFLPEYKLCMFQHFWENLQILTKTYSISETNDTIAIKLDK